MVAPVILEFPRHAARSASSYTAIVRAADGIRFVATADSRSGCTAQLVRYVLERCDYVLWPADAVEIRTLIDRDKQDSAIELYFETVGERWDEEQLEITQR